MIKWNRFDATVKMNELFSPTRLASQVLSKLLSHRLKGIQLLMCLPHFHIDIRDLKQEDVV